MLSLVKAKPERSSGRLFSKTSERVPERGNLSGALENLASPWDAPVTPCEDAAFGGERPHPGHSNLHCTACRQLDKLTMGTPPGLSPSGWVEFAGVRQPVSYHLGCPLVVLDSST